MFRGVIQRENREKENDKDEQEKIKREITKIVI